VTIKSRLAAAEQAAERAAAAHRARLARRPITTAEELLILLTVAIDEGTTEAFVETVGDRATPEIWDELGEAIRLELAERAEQRVEAKRGARRARRPITSGGASSTS
jgi:hypothetical protein